jgi:transcriptional repressor NrdR
VPVLWGRGQPGQGLAADRRWPALRKRPHESDRVERIINSMVRQLESSGETDIPSDMIGELVMEALASLDQVAYIRFASVYRNFREAKDFGEFVGQITADDD